MPAKVVREPVVEKTQVVDGSSEDLVFEGTTCASIIHEGGRQDSEQVACDPVNAVDDVDIANAPIVANLRFTRKQLAKLCKHSSSAAYSFCSWSSNRSKEECSPVKRSVALLVQGENGQQTTLGQFLQTDTG
ncbi:hypothetical protein R1flu_006486 [Riccia fluitans]|uniref:Uncharacterized protein n=1 Tax=Riccia fluitans TaxID=41844 RepID=A0ABD1YZ55_9MARC